MNRRTRHRRGRARLAARLPVCLGLCRLIHEGGPVVLARGRVGSSLGTLSVRPEAHMWP